MKPPNAPPLPDVSLLALCLWVNRVGWAISACLLHPQLRTAANRRFGPEATYREICCNEILHEPTN